MRKHIENLLLAAICGACAIGVNYISKMSENINQMTISVQILTEKLTSIDRNIQDHEQRLRLLERP